MSRGVPGLPGLHAGDVLSGRYRLDDLLAESGRGRFWRAHDTVLARHVAVHVIPGDDPRGDALLDAARRSAGVSDRRLLRVLDADCSGDLCFVVNEWGRGTSLDTLLGGEGPLDPHRAAWVVAEVAEVLAVAHEAGVPHGRLVPENVLLDQHQHVRIAGFTVDAALRGLPPGSVETDLADLAGVLYAALTGRWAGRSASDLARAPTAHGELLRPRQVRAGIPRALEVVCHSLLDDDLDGTHAHRLHDLATARGIAEALREVADPGPHGPTEAGPAGHRPAPWSPAPPETPETPETPVGAPAVESEPEPEPDQEQDAGPDATPDAEPDDDREDPAGEPTDEADVDAREEQEGHQPEVRGPEEVPTQAGMPIFHEDDDVSWLQRSAEPPPPPPVLEDPPERPLFAPDPPEGQPARRPRPGVATGPVPPEDDDGAGTAGGLWPWGTGAVPPTPVPPPAEAGTDNPAGRTWTRLGLVLVVCLLLALGALVVNTLGQGSPPDDAAPDDGPTSQAPPSAEATPVRGISADDFDPQGSPPQEEYPSLTPAAVDGDPSTAWRTATYRQNFGPAGLKTGVGLILDLDRTVDVAEVDVTVVGQTSFDVFVTSQKPSADSGVDGLTAVGTGSGDGTVTVTLETPTTGRHVTVWLTSLPEVADGFRAQVVDVEVRAR